MDDFWRRVQEQQDMIRRLSDTAAKYFRDNEALVSQAQQTIGSLDERAFAAASLYITDTDKVLRDLHKTSLAESIESARILPQLVGFAEVSHTALARLAMPESISAMELYANQQLELQTAVERIAIAPRAIDEIGGFVRSISATSELTHLCAASVDWNRIATLWNVTKRKRDPLAEATAQLALRHANLITSLELAEGRLASAPSFVSELPTLDLFAHTAAVRSITPHEPLSPATEKRTKSLRRAVTAETSASIEEALAELHPPFVSQYRGIKARANDRGPDSWSQGAASMRKLLKGVLHRAAPDDAVLPWAVQNKKALDSSGRPTRATKVEWLCRFVRNEEFRSYAIAELTSALALIKLLDVTQHVDEFPEFEHQSDLIGERVEVAVRFFLEVWKFGRQ